MKKLVLAMACVLSLGLLASCKNGVQDVNVKNANDTEGALFVGTVELTATPVQSNTSTKAWEASTPANDAFAVGPQHATVAWATSSEKYDTNVKNFTLKFYVEYNGDTTSTSHNPSYVEKSVTFYSVGDKY